MTKNKIN